VKRLRPADLVPYRYDDIQPTGWLWVSEGITDYYADIATLRAGIDDSTAFLSSTGSKIGHVAGAPPTALADASFSSWINPTDGSAGLYYPKGSVAGFLLDICIRDASNGRASLDHVMRTLYTTTYGQHRGFTATDWWGTISRAAGGRSFASFNRRFVEGREPFPYDSILPLAGLKLQIDTMQVIQLGIGGEPDSLGLTVSVVVPGSTGARAGIRVGDHLVSVGQIQMHGDSSWMALNQRYGTSADSTLTVVVRREGGEIGTLTTQIVRVARPEGRLVIDPNASAKAARVRHGLFTGT
jgi:predicted metalloprotease with PDZ domain